MDAAYDTTEEEAKRFQMSIRKGGKQTEFRSALKGRK